MIMKMNPPYLKEFLWECIAHSNNFGSHLQLWEIQDRSPYSRFSSAAETKSRDPESALKISCPELLL